MENGKNETTSFYEKYHQKDKANAKRERERRRVESSRKIRSRVLEEKKSRVVEEKIAPRTRILGSDGSLYFKEVDKFNLNEIVDGFDEQEYINGLKKASQ